MPNKAAKVFSPEKPHPQLSSDGSRGGMGSVGGAYPGLYHSPFLEFESSSTRVGLEE